MAAVLAGTCILACSGSEEAKKNHGLEINEKLVDENAKLRQQNEQLARDNSLLKASVQGLEDKVRKAKGKVRQVDHSYELKGVHAHAQIRTCEQQVKDLSEGLVEHGDTARVKEAHDRAQKALHQMHTAEL